jgi:two-component system sensor histidine kinase KdpD
MKVESRVPMRTELGGLVAGASAIAAATAIERVFLSAATPTIAALSFVLIVLVVAVVSTRRVAVAVSLVAFGCFNFFFLSPIGTFTIAKPDDWAALFVLLTVSIVASHLSSMARQRARQTIALVEQRNDAEMARRSAEVKSALVASLSHDLKTPLTAMTLAVGNLAATALTEDQRREQIGIVRTELDRLTRLFHNMIDMASIEARALNAAPDWVQPAEIIEAALRQTAEAVNGRIEIDGGAERTLVRLDPRLTSAALAHILENAVTYSPAGSPITIAATVTDSTLRIAVRDRGPGLPAGDPDRLFERFHRASGTRPHRFGSGLGLAITRGLLAAEGGRVGAANHPDGGAIFTIEVPGDVRPLPDVDEEPI